MIEIAATVEHDLVDASRLGPLGERLADALGGFDIRAGLQLLAHRLLQRRGGGEGDALGIVDHLRVDLLGGAEHAEARTPASVGGEAAADARLAALGGGELLGHYFFFPSLRKMNSPAYLTPLPLYGSGPRKSRISAATWPTCRLSMPVTVSSVGFGAVIVIPAGIG